MNTWRIVVFLVWTFPAISLAQGLASLTVQKTLTFQEVDAALNPFYTLDCPAGMKASTVGQLYKFPFTIEDKNKRRDDSRMRHSPDAGQFTGGSFAFPAVLFGNWSAVTIYVVCIRLTSPAPDPVTVVASRALTAGSSVVFEGAFCPVGQTVLGGISDLGGAGQIVEQTALIDTTTAPLNLPPSSPSPDIWFGLGTCSAPGCRIDVTAVCGNVAGVNLVLGTAAAGGQQVPPASKRVAAKAAVAPGEVGTVSVTCPAGMLSTAGGYAASDAAHFTLQNLTPRTPGTPYQNRPDGTYEGANGWSATILNTGTATNQIGVTAICAAAASPSTTVIEFFNTTLKHYFRTAESVEATAIDGGAAGPGWMRTGLDFTGYVAGVGPGNDVCRFYNPVANTHFYTADPDECTQVKLPDSGWRYEGLSFRIQLPSAGICPQGTISVRRLYNNRFAFNDSNHRFTTSQSVYDDMVAQGWLGEGVVMCALS